MKMTLRKTLFVSFTLLAAVSTVNAEEALNDEIVSNLEENVTVDSRPLSPQKKKLMEKKRQDEIDQNEQMLEEESIELSGLVIPIKTQNLIMLASNQYNATDASYSPYLYHWIDHFPQSNSLIKLEDGAEWFFDVNEAHVVRSWRPGDTIVITPKGGWFWSSNYSYVLTNRDLGTSVNVNLSLGPIAFGPNSMWVGGIDLMNGLVHLTNGQGEKTVWEVSSSDMYLFKEEWAVNDTIIVGENDSWLSLWSPYNHIFLNVNMNHYIRVRQMSNSPNVRKSAETAKAAAAAA